MPMPDEILNSAAIALLRKLADRTVYSTAKAGDSTAISGDGQSRSKRSELWNDAQPRVGQRLGVNDNGR